MKFQSYAPGLILTLTLDLDPFTPEEATATPMPSSFQMTLRALVSLWPYILFNDRRAKLSSNLGCLSTEMQASAGVHVNTHIHTHRHSHTLTHLFQVTHYKGKRPYTPTRKRGHNSCKRDKNNIEFWT